jgi:hypothetical protein
MMAAFLHQAASGPVCPDWAGSVPACLGPPGSGPAFHRVAGEGEIHRLPAVGPPVSDPPFPAVSRVVKAVHRVATAAAVFRDFRVEWVDRISLA